MFHRFDELGDEPYLVRCTEFEYADLDYSQPATIEAELAHQGVGVDGRSSGGIAAPAVTRRTDRADSRDGDGVGFVT